MIAALLTNLGWALISIITITALLCHAFPVAMWDLIMRLERKLEDLDDD